MLVNEMPVDRSGRDAVDANAQRRELDAEMNHEVVDRRLCRTEMSASASIASAWVNAKRPASWMKPGMP